MKEENVQTRTGPLPFFCKI